MNITLPPHWVLVTFYCEPYRPDGIKWVILDADKREARKIIHDAWREANAVYGGNYTLEDFDLWPDNYKQYARTLIAQGHYTRYEDPETESAIAFLDDLARNR